MRYKLALIALPPVLAAILWAALLLTGCVPIKVEEPTITGIDVSKQTETTTTTTVPVSVGDVGGNVTVNTLANATPWGLVVFTWCGLYYHYRRHRTAVGALDRVVRAIEDADPTETRRQIKTQVMGHYKCNKHGEIIIDRLERFLRSRLARMTDDDR